MRAGAVQITPAKRIQGVYRPPADKSIAHRALILSAIANGRSTIAPVSRSADVASTVSCLKQLGVGIEQDATGWVVQSNGWGQWIAPERALDCGNSGTTMRLMCGALAGARFGAALIGDDSLSRRPMGRVSEPLRRMGASITLAAGDCAPVQIEGMPLRGIEYDLPVPSAQVKSAVLLAGLFAQGPVSVIEQSATRDHTERMLAAAGVDCIVETPKRPTGDRREMLLSGTTIEVPANLARRTIRLGDARVVRPRDWTIPGDFSAAAFFIAAAAGARRAELIIDDVGLNPTRTGLLRVLRRMGAEIEVRKREEPDG